MITRAISWVRGSSSLRVAAASLASCVRAVSSTFCVSARVASTISRSRATASARSLARSSNDFTRALAILSS